MVVVIDMGIRVFGQMVGEEAHKAFEGFFLLLAVMRPEWLEFPFAILEIIHPEQILQTILENRIALHVKEQITIVRHGYAAKTFARREWNELVFVFASGGFVMLQYGLRAQALKNIGIEIRDFEIGRCRS